MRQYVNRFDIAYNQNNGEIMLDFAQEGPEFKNLINGTPEITNEPIAQLVLSTQIVNLLIQQLQNVLNAQKDTDK